MSRTECVLRSSKDDVQTHGSTRVVSVLIILTFLTTAFAPMVIIADVDGGPFPDTTSRAASRLANLIIDPDTWHNVTTTEAYMNVTVKDGAVLNVRSTFTAYSITLQGGSLIVASSATLKIQGIAAPYASAIYGYGPYLEVDGKVYLTGPASGNVIDTSQGGRAKIDYLADDHITVKGTIEVTGNNGASPPGPGPWKAGGVGGWVSAGGSANIKLRTRQKAGTKLLIQGATMNVYGGKAGSAIDGSGSMSGGFTQGGAASDHVGAGGYANITISGYSVQIIDATMQAFGGQGGNGGKGGDASGTSTGGGGGYAGGSGSTGVVAMDYVGSGGGVNLDFFATSTGVISGRSRISASGGAGGSGGPGGGGAYGDWSGGPGGGGGGYGGGQGGSVANPGEAATVVGYVGSGGTVTASFSAGDNFALIGTTALNLGGGHGGGTQGGGFAGGGQSGGGGGGGGYGGGGGGGGTGWDGAAGGGTTVGGRVGDGGDVVINFDERAVSIGKAVDIMASGGLKGDGTTAPGTAASSGGYGGKGSGRSTNNGMARYTIPMTAPYIKAPADGAILNTMPTFQWEMAHDTGPSAVTSVKGYILDLSTNSSMAGAEVIELDPSKSGYKPESLEGGQYWWRLKTKYSDLESDVVSSSTRTFYYNKPPWLKKSLPAIRVNEDTNKTNYLNLDDYFTDDLYPNTIVYSIVQDTNVHWVTLNLTGSRNQNVNVNVTHYFTGTEFFNFSAKDEGGLVGVSGKVSVVVVPVPHAPRINDVPNQTVTEDSESVLSLNDLGLFDPESWHAQDPVLGLSVYSIGIIAVKSDSKYITFVKDSISSPPSINMIMNFQMSGAFWVNLTLSDGILSSIKQFHVNVTAVNDPPKILPIPDVLMIQDVPKTVDLKQYSYDEEDPVTALKWKVRIKDTRLLDFQLEEGNLLRLVSKPLISGDTTIYLTVTDRDGSISTAAVIVKISAVNYPPRFKDDHLNIPKGVTYTLDLRTVMVDVDSNIKDMSISGMSFLNANNSVEVHVPTTAIFNYPDNGRTNDTLLITVENAGATGSYNLTVQLGYAPFFKKKLTSISFLSDEKLILDMKNYVTDKDDNMSNLKFDIKGYDDTLLQPQVNPSNGKITISAFKAGSGNMTLIVTDKMGFQLTQNVKVTIEQPTGMTFLKRNPAVLATLVLVIVLVVVLLVLIVTSRKFGKPFKGMKKETAPAAQPVAAPGAVPPPPAGFVEGQGWVQPPGAPPAEPGAPAPTSYPEAVPGAPPPPPPPPPQPVGPEPAPAPTPAGAAPEPAKPAGPMIGDPQERETKRRIRELKRKERHGDMTEKEEDELAHLEAQLEGGAAPILTKCPKCGEAVEPDFIKCPSCNQLLKK